MIYKNRNAAGVNITCTCFIWGAHRRVCWLKLRAAPARWILKICVADVLKLCLCPQLLLRGAPASSRSTADALPPHLAPLRLATDSHAAVLRYGPHRDVSRVPLFWQMDDGKYHWAQTNTASAGYHLHDQKWEIATFIFIVLYTVQIILKKLHSDDNNNNSNQFNTEDNSVIIHINPVLF